MRLRAAPAIWLFLGMAPTAFAQPSVAIRAEANPQEIYVGDQIAFNLFVTVSSDVACGPVATSTAIGNFDVLVISSPTATIDKDGKTTSAYHFLLTTFSTGTQTIPPIPMQFAIVGGPGTETTTEPINIKVRSLLEEKGDEGNIRPLKGLFDFKSYFWLWVLAALVGTALLLWLGWRWIKIQRAGGVVIPAVPPRPADQVAWEAITHLENENLVAAGQTKEFYYRLSVILREYLEARYQMSAMEKTTSELLAEFRKRSFSMTITQLSRDFFDSADLVKFAKFTPSAEDVASDLNKVKQFITFTTPQQQEAAPAEDKVTL